jgi:FAD/FMN-containing dehydrogenase
VRELHGSISAEHGVGRLKRDEFTYYKSPVEIELMQILALKSYLRRVILAPG